MNKLWLLVPVVNSFGYLGMTRAANMLSLTLEEIMTVRGSADLCPH